ncbi:hypothetical protein LTR15_008104 [Elasticomyces elasticus]|nr:hypothetical protein LTR15_008104 [Elasticomyces elasticus]
MPYNTRRKSLSLSELGIIVPKRSRTASHPSPPNTIVEGEEPPVKKSKRSHGSTSPPPTGLMSPPRTTTIRFKEEKPKQAVELSPPPSPAAEGCYKVDVEGISDEIVKAAIQQIEKTGNRPHLVKELAHVLASSLHSIEKLFFYLTTTQHQPIPEVAEPFVAPKRNISPPQSSASAEEDERYNRRRTALSPSPEVDLSSPELDQDTVERPPTPGAPFSGRNSLSRDSRSSSLSHPKRAASPQLEREERDFKQTANQLYEQAQLRRNSLQQDTKMEQDDAVAGAERDDVSVSMSIEETEENAALRHHADAAALFGHAEHLKIPSAPIMMDFSSPMMRPQCELHLDLVPSPMKMSSFTEHTENMALDPTSTGSSLSLLDTAFAWDTLQSPENIELAELDDMFDAY